MNRVKNFIGAMSEKGVRTLLFQYVCACVCGKSNRNLSDHIRI